MSRIRMYNDYFPPYKAAVDGVGSAMASFNEVDGIPATGNKWLMTDVSKAMGQRFCSNRLYRDKRNG
jgi:beta-glucosidase-like glycosyl hydrolase